MGNALPEWFQGFVVTMWFLGFTAAYVEESVFVFGGQCPEPWIDLQSSSMNHKSWHPGSVVEQLLHMSKSWAQFPPFKMIFNAGNRNMVKRITVMKEELQMGSLRDHVRKLLPMS